MEPLTAGPLAADIAVVSCAEPVCGSEGSPASLAEPERARHLEASSCDGSLDLPRRECRRPCVATDEGQLSQAAAVVAGKLREADPELRVRRQAPLTLRPGKVEPPVIVVLHP